MPVGARDRAVPLHRQLRAVDPGRSHAERSGDRPGPLRGLSAGSHPRGVGQPVRARDPARGRPADRRPAQQELGRVCRPGRAAASISSSRCATTRRARRARSGRAIRRPRTGACPIPPPSRATTRARRRAFRDAYTVIRRRIARFTRAAVRHPRRRRPGRRGSPRSAAS